MSLDDAAVMMGEMTWTEVAEALERDPVVFLPTGTVEQHGPHLPLGVDYLLPQAISADAARELGGLVAPPVTYGYKSLPRSGGGPFFPGSTGLDGATLSATIRDILREFARHGIRRVVVLDGHFENRWFLNDGIEQFMREPAGEALSIMCLQHWDMLSQETLDQVFPEEYPGIELEHAAVLETSLMMHFYPDLVRTDRIPDNLPAGAPAYDVWPARQTWVPKEGSLVSAVGASREKGALMADQCQRDIVAAVRREFELT